MCLLHVPTCYDECSHYELQTCAGNFFLKKEGKREKGKKGEPKKEGNIARLRKTEFCDSIFEILF